MEFTPEQQEHLNRLVGEARTAGRDAALKGFFTELGVDSADGLKAILKEHGELKTKGMSDAERYKAEAEAARKEAETQKAELAAVKRTAGVKAALAKAGLPEELAGRVQGNTDAEIDADVKELGKLFGGKGPEQRSILQDGLAGGDSQRKSTEKALAQAFRAALGR
jgi:hypothetical protein